MMQRLVADLTLPIVLSDRALRQLATVKHARHDLEQSHHWEPSREEIANSTGYTQEQLDSLTCVELSPRSLDEPLQADDGAGGTLAELLADPHSGEGYYAVDQELEADFLRQRPNDLGTRERLVLRARYGFDGPIRTLHEVGDELDVSAERVRQIQEGALEKLRVACSSELSDMVALSASRDPAHNYTRSPIGLDQGRPEPKLRDDAGDGYDERDRHHDDVLEHDGSCERQSER
jgi:DNA-directed RNA polymerase sigma subunit (sigma70/sigma32)